MVELGTSPEILKAACKDWYRFLGTYHMERLQFLDREVSKRKGNLIDMSRVHFHRLLTHHIAEEGMLKLLNRTVGNPVAEDTRNSRQEVAPDEAFARKLQEEEDQNAAEDLQDQLNRESPGPGHADNHEDEVGEGEDSGDDSSSSDGEGDSSDPGSSREYVVRLGEGPSRVHFVDLVLGDATLPIWTGSLHAQPLLQPADNDHRRFSRIQVKGTNYAFPKALLELSEPARFNLPSEVAAYLVNAAESRFPETKDTDLLEEMALISASIDIRGKLTAQPAWLSYPGTKVPRYLHN